jgi:hypothetical protein
MSGSLDDGHSNYFSNNWRKYMNQDNKGPAAARRAKQQGSAGSATRAEARAATRASSPTKRPDRKADLEENPAKLAGFSFEPLKWNFSRMGERFLQW